MNASGRLNTCKSSEKVFFGELESGARMSNAYTTYLLEGDSLGKLRLIPHVIMFLHRDIIKDPSLKDGCAYD